MKILSISGLNLNSLKGPFSIDFADQPLQGCGLFAITGPTGAGKTTILDALTLALYGDVARKADVESIMSYGCGECHAEVVFSTAKGTFKAKWSGRRARGKADGKFQGTARELADWPSGENIITRKSEVEERMYDITGLTKDQFLKSVLLAQGDFTAFLKAKANERADLLEKMTSTEEYRRLSRRAYRKKDEEEQKLQRLTDRLGGIHMLSGEEEGAKRQSLTDLEEQTKTLRKERAVQEGARQWIDTQERLAAERTAAQSRYQLALQRKEAEHESFQKWDAHAAVVPFEGRILAWHQSEENLATLLEAVRQIEAGMDAVRAEKNDAEEEVNGAAVDEASARELLEGQRPMIQQAITNGQLNDKERQSINELQQRADEKGQRLQESRERLAKAEADYSAQKEQSGQLGIWLSEHAVDATLADALKTCHEKLPLLMQLREQAHAYTREAAHHQQAIEKSRQQLQAAGEQDEIAATKLDGQSVQEQELATTLSQWHSFAKYQKNQHEEALQSAEQSLKEATRELTAKEVFLAHHQALEEGAPCPLCGSELHPAALQNIGEMEAAVALLRAEQERMQAKCSAEQKSLDSANALLSLLSDFPPSEDFPKDLVNTDASVVHAHLKAYRKVPAEKAKLLEQRETAKKNKCTAQEAEREAMSAVGNVQDALKAASASGKEVAAVFETTALQFKEHYKAGSEHALINALEKRSLDFTTKKGNQETLNASLAGAETIIKNELRQVENLAQEHESLQGQAAERLQALAAQEQENRKQIPEAFSSPAAYLAHLEKGADAAGQKLRNANTRLSTATTNLATQVALLARKQEERQTAQAHLEHVCKALSADLLSAGLPADIKTAATQLLDAPIREQIRMLVESMNGELALSAEAVCNTDTAFQSHKATPHTELSKEEILAALASVEIRITEADQQTGALREALAANDANKAKQEELLSEMESQRIEMARWRELSALIGSANGDAFVRFAQTISLEQLLHFANEHLRGLSNRYQLRCNTDIPEDLNLMVEDKHLAGSTRDTKTLSGGESFLVSLGLALGLAEMASQATRIDSLFIDEGFGTLDEAALDDAITTLEGLQARGKTIGVISHVEQLKDRIQTQIVVSMRGNGYSQVSVVP